MMLYVLAGHCLVIVYRLAAGGIAYWHRYLDLDGLGLGFGVGGGRHDLDIGFTLWRVAAGRLLKLSLIHI